MYDKDKRRIIRLTKDPKETYRRLEIIAAYSGVSVEQAAANCLSLAIDGMWAAASVAEDYFKIDCLCCPKEDGDQVSAVAAPSTTP